MLKQMILLLPIIIALLVADCQTGQNAVNTEMRTTCVTGKILRSNGAVPASGVPVTMRLKNETVPVFGNDSVTTEMVTTTNREGSFSIDRYLDSGVYVIEASDKNETVMIDSVIVDDKISSIDLPPGILKPGGAIQGKIATVADEINGDVFVLVTGINRFIPVAKDGRFLFDNLPEGTLHLRFVTSAADYGSPEITPVKVVSCDTTDIGMVTLPRIVMPVPGNLRATYNARLLTVTVTWDAPVISGGVRYSIFRKTARSASVDNEEISRKSIDGTCYIDSFLTHENIYEYRVVSVDGIGRKSLKSDPVIVDAKSYLKHDSIKTFLHYRVKEDSAFNSENEVIYLSTEDICRERNGLHYVVNCAMENLSWAGCCGGNVAITMYDKKTYTILGMNSNGKIVDSISSMLHLDNTIDCSWVKFAITDTYIFVLERKSIPSSYQSVYQHDSILVFTRSGELTGKWDCGEFGKCIAITGGENDQLYMISNASSDILLYNRDGTVVKTLAVPHNHERSIDWAGWIDWDHSGTSYSLFYNQTLKNLFMAFEDDRRLLLWIFNDKYEPYIGYFDYGEEYWRLEKFEIEANSDSTFTGYFDTDIRNARSTMTLRFPSQP